MRLITLRLIPQVLLILSAGGCDVWQKQFAADQKSTAQVPGNPFGIPPQMTSKAGLTPAEGDVAWRVDFVGRKLLAANPNIGLKPLFATIKSPQAEIFHQGNRIVYVTDGLVNRCKNETELAAVLASELGKMVADREASNLASGQEKLPPIATPIGNAANLSGPDQTALAELGRFEKENPRKLQVRPDPRNLAGVFLEKAGYPKTELDTVRPILQAAERNYALEKQLNANPFQPKWSP